MYPLLRTCLLELHNFDLLEHLMQDCAEQLTIAENVYAAVRSQEDQLAFSIWNFAYWVRWSLRENSLPDWAIDAIDKDENTSENFATMLRQRERLERHFGCYWVFDCPVCRAPESAVAKLGESELNFGRVIALRLVCVHCGFSVRADEGILSKTLLEDQVAQKHSEILKEYGIDEAPPQA